MSNAISHESLDRHEQRAPVRPRATALVLAAIALVAAWWFDGAPNAVRVGLLGLCIGLLGAAAMRARFLEPLSSAWMSLARLLGKVMDPLVLGLMFTVLFVPVGLAMRLFRRDALHLRRAAATESYWRDREDPSSAGAGMKNQF